MDITPDFPPARSPKIAKKDFKARRTALRRTLVLLQRQLLAADFPMLVVVAGVDGAGKHESINLFNHWMDPRYLDTLAWPPEAPEVGPEMQPYWQALPPRGEAGLVLSGWYSPPLLARVDGRDDDARFAERLERITRFEQMLTDDGALICKFWLHLDADAQRERLQRLASNAETAWKASANAWRNLQRYEQFVAHTRTLLSATDRPLARWTVLDGSNERARTLGIGEVLAEALRERLARRPPPRRHAFRLSEARRLDTVDLDQTLAKDAYKARMKRARRELAFRLRLRAEAGRATVLVFEGWDAAGKGGAIWRLVRGLDARSRQVIPIAPPNDEEAARHYLWRFWRRLPAPGQLHIFDRSWYGRVLVERIEDFATKFEWQRAFEEINGFEAELTEGGIDVLKFWLHISPEEQLARFRAREASADKQHKLTEEDWRNREKRPAYLQAVEDMLARTDTAVAPWRLIAADDKRHARVAIIEAVNAWLDERSGFKDGAKNLASG